MTQDILTPDRTVRGVLFSSSPQPDPEHGSSLPYFPRN